MIDGAVLVGEEQELLDHDEVGWLNRLEDRDESELTLSAGVSGTRFVLYSGQPQGVKIVSHGPFIGDTNDDITRLYREFRGGKMQHVSALTGSPRISW